MHRGSSSVSSRSCWPSSWPSSPKEPSTPRRWRCSESSRRVSRRCAWRVPASMDSSRSGSCSFWRRASSGAGFGFVLGAVAFFASALITGGSGPVVAVPDAGGGVGRFRCRLPAPDAWLPGAAAARRVRRGVGPRVRTAHQFLVLAVRGVDDDLLLRAGLGTIANLHRFILFDLTTSLGFDLTRAVTCAVLILVLGRPVLAALRRASRRAVFEPQIDFVEAASPRSRVAE
jgi:hypothetical protein